MSTLRLENETGDILYADNDFGATVLTVKNDYSGNEPTSMLLNQDQVKTLVEFLDSGYTDFLLEARMIKISNQKVLAKIDGVWIDESGVAFSGDELDHYLKNEDNISVSRIA